MTTIRPRQEGWRSAQSRARVAAAPEAPPLAAPSPPGGGASQPARQLTVNSTRAWMRGAADALHTATSTTIDLAGQEQVKWTLVYVAFLIYMLAITTYRIPVGTAGVALAVLGLAVQREKLTFPPLLKWYAIYLVWCIVGYVQSAHPDVVQDTITEQVKVWIIALVAVNALRTRGQARVFMIFYLACFALYPVRGTFYNYHNGYMRFGRAAWNGIYSNPNDLAALTILHMSIAASLLVTENKRWTRIAAAAGMIVLPAVVLLTQSRGAMIALGAFVGFSWLGQRRKLRGLLVLAVAGAVVAVAAPKSVWERMKGLRHATNTENLRSVDPEGSARQRYEIWRIAATVIREHPVMGVGLGAYNLTHAAYATRPEFEQIALGPRDTHDTYLRVTADTGFVGLAIFLTLVGATVVPVERLRRRCRVVLPRAAAQLYFLEMGLLAFFIAGIFGSFASLSFLYVQFALLTACAELARRELKALDTGLMAAA